MQEDNVMNAVLSANELLKTNASSTVIVEGGPVLLLTPFRKTVKYDDYSKKGEMFTGSLSYGIATNTDASALITDNFNYADIQVLIDLVNNCDIKQINIIRGMSSSYKSPVGVATKGINSDYRIIDDLQESLTETSIINDKLNINPVIGRRPNPKFKTFEDQLVELVEQGNLPKDLKIIEIQIRKELRQAMSNPEKFNDLCNGVAQFTKKSELRIINDKSLREKHEGRRI